MSKNVLQAIRGRMESFSRGQKRIADYILMNYDKAAFMTAGHLGRKAQVSESTVVRFASQLGYEGYPNMQRALQELVRGRLTSLQRIQVSRDQMQEQDVLTGVMQRDMNSIHTAIEQLDRAAFDRVVDRQPHLSDGGAVVGISGGVSELLSAPDVQERDSCAERCRRRNL